MTTPFIGGGRCLEAFYLPLGDALPNLGYLRVFAVYEDLSESELATTRNKADPAARAGSIVSPKQR